MNYMNKDLRVVHLFDLLIHKVKLAIVHNFTFVGNFIYVRTYIMHLVKSYYEDLVNKHYSLTINVIA